MKDTVDDAKRADRAIEALLAALEEDLNKEAGLDYSENSDQEDDIFEVFFEDLDLLKSIFSYKKVMPENIEWFLHSDLFCFIADSLGCFTVALKDIYKALLQNASIEKQEYFMQHKEVLIAKANSAVRNQERFDRREFFLILAARKNDSKVKTDFSKHSNKRTFIKKAKVRKAVTFSPVAQQAIRNHLRQSKLFISKQVAIPEEDFARCMPGVCAHNAARR